MSDINSLSTEQTNEGNLLGDVVDVPEKVWIKEDVHKLRNQKGKRLKRPPRNATIAIKVIYNKGWERSAGRKDERNQKKIAKQKAIDVIRKAEFIFNDKFAVEKRLGTAIKLKMIGGKY